MNRRASVYRPPAYESLETYNMKGGVKVIERFFIVPLDHSNLSGPSIRIFARNLIPTKKAKTKDAEEKLPYILFLQGGPGFEVPFPDLNGYVAEVHEQGYQILLLDPRGTGLSTPIHASTLPPLLRTSSPSAQSIASYLKHFRAPSIVRDCEHIRNILLGSRDDPEAQKWTILGQSFGGFCAVSYLSIAPESLKEVFITGGLAPLIEDPDLNYENTVLAVIKRNRVYYEKYPRDVQRIRNIFAHLDSKSVTLPNGGNLTVQRFQQLGLDFGMSDGIDRVHQLVFLASNDLDIFDKLSYKTLQTIQERQSFDGNPIYAILHEAIYCQDGHSSRWSASRILKKYPQFDWNHVKNLDELQPVYLTGEMILPSMFEDYYNLRPFKEAAEILAETTEWGSDLFNLEQLARNEVKVTAATYYDDMYLPFDLAQDTAERIGNVEQYITNQLFHSGLRDNGREVMKKLFEIGRREKN